MSVAAGRLPGWRDRERYSDSDVAIVRKEVRIQMKIATVSLALLLLFSIPAAAQMDQNRMEQMAWNATVQPGPQMRWGLPFSADVFVNGVFAMRIPASAGGLSPTRRAEIIAGRLNQAFQAGASWQDMRVTQTEGLWTVNLDDNLIATADVNSARAYQTSTGQLAGRWARQSVVAMGGQPQMIAQQLQPVTEAVAGAQQEIGVPPDAAAAWAASPTRSVPLLDAESGEQLGMVTVAGPASRLNAANAVVLYTSPAEDGTAYLMVPITGRTTTGTVTRAQGVGVVGVPADVVPMEAMMTGTQLPQFTQEMRTDLGNVITDELRDQDVATGASTTVVPLYSMDANEVVGAAHIVGNAAQIARAQAVVMSTSNNMLMFQAVPTAPPVMGTPQPLNNVVLSGVVLWTAESPDTTAPDATTPDMTTPDTTDETPDTDDSESVSPEVRDPEATPDGVTEPGEPGSNF